MTDISKKFCAAAAAMALVLSQTSVYAFADNNAQTVPADEIFFNADENTTADEDITESVAATEEEDYAAGDINNDGKLNITDAAKVAAFIKAKINLNDKALKAADINEDGKINITDLSIMIAEIKGIRVMNWLELLETVSDSSIVAKTARFSKLPDIVSLRSIVKVDWTAVNGVDGYDVVISGADRSEKYQVKSNSINVNALRWSDDDIINIKVMPFTYYNTETRQGVKSFSDGYEGKLSIKPENVTGLKAKSERNYVKLSWKAAADADVYNVYYTVNGKESFHGQTSELSRQINVPANKDVSFRVLAVNLMGKSYVNADKSATAKVHTLPYYAKAEAVLDKVGWDLHKAFNWCIMPYAYYINGEWLPRDGSPGMEWYADRGFDAHEGNCYVMAACFCEMAKMLGYDAHQISSGTLTSNGFVDHSWVEIKNYNGTGKSYIFDPDFESELGRNGFAISYGDKGTLMYDISGSIKRVIMS